MKRHYDRAANLFYVPLYETKIALTDKMRKARLDYDSADDLVGIEILFVSDSVKTEGPGSVAFEMLLGEAR